MKPIKVAAVVGARPNFMKVAPLAWGAKDRSTIDLRIVHTGQHYDRNMSDLFFEELGIPEPAVNLGVGGGTHASQTAEIMVRFEKYIESDRPDVLLVVGDVNSTIATAMVAVKLGIPTVHVEAGLRSFDRSMPEEINRLLTDAISDVLYVSEPSGCENLKKEGVPDDRVVFVGNVMIDTLLRSRDLAAKSNVLEKLNVKAKRYGLVTLHRPSNVDHPETLRGIWTALERVSLDMKLVFPVHPRTRKRIAELDLPVSDEIQLTEPVGYVDFLRLQSEAALIMTDSGGIQEEATILAVPCLTLRENTERPVTITVGCNRLVGTHPEKIVAAAMDIIHGRTQKPSVPQYWDGRAGVRILDDIERRYSRS